MTGDPMRDWLHGFVSRDAFLGKYRYYAAILARVDPIEDARVPVMAVSRHGRRFFLHVNVDYFTSPPTNFQYVPGVLLHEVHHLALGHLTNPRLRRVEHPDLMELAMEVSANEYIREPLPGDPPRLQTFARFGMKPGQSTRERYEALCEARRDGRLPAAWVYVDTHLPGVGVGVAGGVQPGESDHVRVGRLVRQAAAAAEREMTDGERDAARLAGRHPGEILEELPGVDEPPRVRLDWKTALRMFLARVRAPQHTYTRPNRRFPHRTGEVPGRAYYPKNTPAQHLMAAIDTSGSVRPEELAEVARQLRVMRDLVDITVVECDTVIRRVYRFDGRLTEVAGRGGTDLRPVFAAEFLGEHRPDGIVYFTDGYGPFPGDDPGVRTLWVIINGDEDFHCPWGQRAVMR